MKNRMFCALAVVLVLPAVLGLGLGVQSALAHVDKSWDWHKNPDGTDKRELDYCIHAKLDDNLKDAQEKDGDIKWDEEVIAAAENWNRAGVGWKLTQLKDVDPNDPRCQIVIQADETGPVGLAWTDTQKKIVQEDRGKVKRAEKCIISIDFTPTDKNGNPIKFGKSATSANPEWVIKHEFGHCLRLEHDTAANGAHVMLEECDPKNDAATLNPRDKTEAADAADAKKNPPDVIKAEITPATGAEVVVTDFEGYVLSRIVIPPGAVQSDTDLWVTVDSAFLTPYGDSVPAGMVRVLRSVHLFDVSLQPIELLLPAQIEVSYPDLFEGMPLVGEPVDQQPVVPTGSGLPGISEDSLTLLRDVSNDGDWDVDGSLTPSIDPVAKTVTVSTQLLDAYGLSGFREGPVGGTGEIPVSQPGSSAGPAAGSGSSPPPYAVIAGGAAAAALAIVAGGWYARRRWLR